MAHIVRILPGHTEVTLPSGTVVTGYPQGSEHQAEVAQRLGYPDALQMVLDHDPLHARLCDWLGLPASYSLRLAAGELPAEQVHLAAIEEEAVIAVQRFWTMARKHGQAQDARCQGRHTRHVNRQAPAEGSRGVVPDARTQGVGSRGDQAIG